MQKVWAPRARVVFGVATVLGVFSRLQSYRLTTITTKEPMDITSPGDEAAPQVA